MSPSYGDSQTKKTVSFREPSMMKMSLLSLVGKTSRTMRHSFMKIGRPDLLYGNFAKEKAEKPLEDGPRLKFPGHGA